MTYLAVTDEEDDPISDALAISTGALATAFILNPQLSFGVTGWGVRAIATHPVTIGITAAVVVGGVVSYQIDPDHGLSNYVGFITGGDFGESDIHYWSGGPNDSGYFNVPKNVSVIASHLYSEGKDYATDSWAEFQDDAMKFWIGPKF
jgi:hypothetical protein